MEIKDLQPNKGNVDLVLKVISKEQPRTFEKFGKVGKVCNAKVMDDTGEVVLTLWNDDIDKINVGDKIHLQGGWCSEFKSEKQISAGKFGKIEVVEAGAKQVFTNDPEILSRQRGTGEDDDGEEEVEQFDEEEVVE